MKKFQFTLHALLQFRKEEETHKQKELFLAQTFFEKLVKELNQLTKEFQDIEEEIRSKEQKSLHAAEVVALFDYLKLIRKKIDLLKTNIQEAQYQVNKRRQAVIRAMQKKKVVEHLQEKQLADWTYEYKETEKAFFDELATIRYMQNKIKKHHS